MSLAQAWSAGPDAAHARGRLPVWLERAARYEFWPRRVFYAPMVPWLAYLAARYGGLGALTAANPGITNSGLVGESKADLLARAPRDLLPDFALVRSGTPADRALALADGMARAGLSWPVIFKPDVGERGYGVRLLRTRDQALAYLAQHPGDVIVQRYCPEPTEAGVFYLRRPGAPRGEIFSVTLKRFPVVTGDGRRTLAQLVDDHPRLRLQRAVFMARLGAAARDVPDRGEPRRMAVAGNHCQGTLFVDGQHLAGPGLLAQCERIARAVGGLYVARFDIRAPGENALRQGEGLRLIEINGVAAESTNIYDPSWRLLRAYRTLRAQWEAAYQIGAANRRDRGAVPWSVGRIARAVRSHFGRSGIGPLSD